MDISNPFDLIITKIGELQSAVTILSEKIEKHPATPTITDPGRLLDLAEAAEVMRKPVGTVRHYIHYRNLPAIKVGKSYLIKLDELLLWVNAFKNSVENKEESKKEGVD